jgi:hypothetical protein
MRRRTLLVVVVGLAVVVAAGVVVLWPSETRPTEENLRRIREGMTGAEVAAILGPPGDFSTGPVRFRPLTLQDEDSDLRLDREWTWLTDEGVTFVEFDADGRAQTWSFLAGWREKQNPLENLLWRVKRQWHRWFPE